MGARCDNPHRAETGDKSRAPPGGGAGGGTGPRVATERSRRRAAGRRAGCRAGGPQIGADGGWMLRRAHPARPPPGRPGESSQPQARGHVGVCSGTRERPGERITAGPGSATYYAAREAGRAGRAPAEARPRPAGARRYGGFAAEKGDGGSSAATRAQAALPARGSRAESRLVSVSGEADRLP